MSEIKFTLNEEAVPAFCKRLVNAAPSPLTLALHGDLGAGKTTFARHLGQALGIRTRVTSPSFIGVNAYAPGAAGLGLIHADFYRHDAGGGDHLLEEIEAQRETQPQSWVLAEWAHYAPAFMEMADLKLTIHSSDENETDRAYYFISLSDAGAACLESLDQAGLT